MTAAGDAWGSEQDDEIWPEADLTRCSQAVVPVAAVTEGPLQVRVGGVDPDHAAALDEAPGPLPPIVVHRDTMTLVDGAHRLAAARRRGETQVEALLLDGTLAEAFVVAVRLNSRHGIPLTREDRRAAVQRILASWPSWSDRRIAAIAGVSARTVASVRSRSTADVPQSNARIGVDGRSRPIDAAERRRLAAEFFVREPGATVRQVAAATGLAPATVHDVRRRMTVGPAAPATTAAEVTAGSPVSDVPTVSLPRGAGGFRHAPSAARTGRLEAAGVADILERLREDPSLRATPPGRTLLRLLAMHTLGTATLDQLASAVPTHRRRTIADLARQVAEAWLLLAGQIEKPPRDASAHERHRR